MAIKHYEWIDKIYKVAHHYQTNIHCLDEVETTKKFIVLYKPFPNAAFEKSVDQVVAKGFPVSFMELTDKRVKLIALDPNPKVADYLKALNEQAALTKFDGKPKTSGWVKNVFAKFTKVK